MDSIVDKIKGLLSKTTNSGCTQAEAESASKLAQKLISQYRINLADLEDTIAEDTSSIDQHEFDEEVSARIAQWKIILANNICTANGCKCIITKSNAGYGNKNKITVNKLIFIGFNTDAEVVKYLYAYLVALTEVVAQNELKKHSFSRGEGKTWSNSFKMGMASAVAKRLLEAAKEAKQEAASTAIVKVENKVVNLFPRLGSRDYAGSVNSRDAYSKGYSAGTSANINGRILK